MLLLLLLRLLEEDEELFDEDFSPSRLELCLLGGSSEKVLLRDELLDSPTSHLLLRFEEPSLGESPPGPRLGVSSKALAMACLNLEGFWRSLAPVVTAPSTSSSESLEDSYMLRLAAK